MAPSVRNRMQNGHRWPCMELAGLASHVFDPDPYKKERLWMGDLPENPVSLKMFR